MAVETIPTPDKNASSKKERRMIILINPRFQLTILSYFLALSFITIAIFYCSVMYFFEQFKLKGMAAGLTSDHIFFQFLSEQELTMSYIFIFTTVVTLMILAVAGLIISHKVAGPVFRFSREVDKMMAKDEVYPLKFRDRDFFPELSCSFNNFLNFYEKRRAKKAASSDQNVQRKAI
jgi:hypothetical protein